MATTFEQVQAKVAAFNARWHVNFNLEQYMLDIKTAVPDDVYLYHLKDLFLQAGRNIAGIEDFDVGEFFTSFNQEVAFHFNRYVRGTPDSPDEQPSPVAEYINRLPHNNGNLDRNQTLDMLEKELSTLEDGRMLAEIQAAYEKREVRNRDIMQHARTEITGRRDERDLEARKVAACSLVALKRVHDARPRRWIALHIPTYLAERRNIKRLEKILVGVSGDPNVVQKLLPEREISEEYAAQIRAQIAGKKSGNSNFYKSIINPSEKSREAQEKIRKAEEEAQRKAQAAADMKAHEEEQKRLAATDAIERHEEIVGDPGFENKICNQVKTMLQDLYKQRNKTMKMGEGQLNHQIRGIMFPQLKDHARMFSTTCQNYKGNTKLEGKLHKNIQSLFGEMFSQTGAFDLSMKDRVILAQQLSNLILKEATPVGYLDSMKKYGHNFALKNFQDSVKDTLNQNLLDKDDPDEVDIAVMDAREDLGITKRISIPEVNNKKLDERKSEPIHNDQVPVIQNQNLNVK